MSVTLQIKLNAGAPQTGGVTGAIGDVVQLTAANKSTWNGAARWEIYDYPPSFTVPAGWSTDADGVFYALGNSDPPAFTISGATNWGKYGFRVTVLDGAVLTSDDATALSIPSSGGIKSIMAGESSQFGGTREAWVRDLKADIRALAAGGGGGAGTVTPDPDELVKRDGTGQAFATAFVGPSDAAAALIAQPGRAATITGQTSAVLAASGGDATVRSVTADVRLDVGAADRRMIACVGATDAGVIVPMGLDALAIYPSGDVTGVTDAAAITAARTAGRTIYLVPDAEYYTAARISTLGMRCNGGRACVRFGTGNGMAIVDGDVATDYLDAVDGAPFSRLPAQPTVIIMNGQSNAAAGPEVTYGFSALTELLGADLLGWSDSSAAFVQLVDGTANMRANSGGYSPGTLAGPGGGQVLTRLAREIADASGETVRTFALAYTSQNIDYFRSGSATKAYYENGSQHATLNNYDLLAQEVAASGYDPQLIVFIQGEANDGDGAAYHTKLTELVSDWAVDYPNAHIVIVKTLGLTATTNAAIAAAQQQVADENPHVHALDNSDMIGHTAWWGSGTYVGEHYTTFIGYEEVALRIGALLRGETRAPVVRRAMTGVAYPFQHLWMHSGLFSPVNGDLESWYDSIPTAARTLSTAGGGFPAWTASSEFGDRKVAVFTKANSDGFVTAALAETDTDWTIHATVKITDFSTQNWIVVIIGGGRIGIQTYTTGRYALDYGGTTFPFPNTVPPTTPHTLGVTVDGTNLVARLYINGVFTEQISITTLQTCTTPVVYVGNVYNALHLNGTIAQIAIGTGLASDQQMRAAYEGSAIEYQLAGYDREHVESDALSISGTKDGTATLTFGKVHVISAGGAISALPLASTGIGRSITIVNRTSGTLTVNRAGSDTIDGATSVNITTGNKATFIAVEAADWTVLT